MCGRCAADRRHQQAGTGHATNPLGVKGVGETGTTGSLAAIVHAVANAVGGDAHKLDMPLTAEKVWRA